MPWTRSMERRVAELSLSESPVVLSPYNSNPQSPTQEDFPPLPTSPPPSQIPRLRRNARNSPDQEPPSNTMSTHPSPPPNPPNPPSNPPSNPSIPGSNPPPPPPNNP